MLINDYSQLDLTAHSEGSTKITISEVITAGMIFVLPVIFLLLISAN